MPAKDLYLGPVSKRGAFTNRRTHPLLLNLILLDEFGPEYVAWEPETCWEEIQRTWGTTISEVSRNKIQALRTCYATFRAYEQWEVFEKVCAGLSGDTPLFYVMQPPNPHGLAFGIDVMRQINDKTEFNDEVMKYAAAALLEGGVVCAPKPIEAANKFIVQLVEGPIHREVRAAVDNHTVRNRPEVDLQVKKVRSIQDYLDLMANQLQVQVTKALS